MADWLNFADYFLRSEKGLLMVLSNIPICDQES